MPTAKLCFESVAPPHSTAYSSCFFHCRHLVTDGHDIAHYIRHGHQICNCNCTLQAHYPTGTLKGCTSQAARERQDLSCTYLAHHELESVLVIIFVTTTTTFVIIIVVIECRITALGLVPIAPAQCCKTCLSKTIHPLDSCSDLNFCSGHGVCNLGSCDCLDGFGGPDCSSQVSPVSLLLHLLLSGC